MSSVVPQTDVRFRILLCRIPVTNNFCLVDCLKPPIEGGLVAVLKPDGLYVERYKSQNYIGVVLPVRGGASLAVGSG